MKKINNIFLIIAIVVFLLCLVKISFWGININSDVDGKLDIDIGNQDRMEDAFGDGSFTINTD